MCVCVYKGLVKGRRHAGTCVRGFFFFFLKRVDESVLAQNRSSCLCFLLSSGYLGYTSGLSLLCMVFFLIVVSTKSHPVSSWLIHTTAQTYFRHIPPWHTSRASWFVPDESEKEFQFFHRIRAPPPPQLPKQRRIRIH